MPFLRKRKETEDSFTGQSQNGGNLRNVRLHTEESLPQAGATLHSTPAQLCTTHCTRRTKLLLSTIHKRLEILEEENASINRQNMQLEKKLHENKQQQTIKDEALFKMLHDDISVVSKRWEGKLQQLENDMIAEKDSLWTKLENLEHKNRMLERRVSELEHGNKGMMAIIERLQVKSQTLEENMEKTGTMKGVVVSKGGKDTDGQREVSPDRHHETQSSFSGVSVSMEDQVEDTRVPKPKTTPLHGEPDASDVICEKSKLNYNSPGFTQTFEENMEKIETMKGVVVSEEGKDNDCQREVSPDRHHKTQSSFSGVSVSMEGQVEDTRVPKPKTTPWHGEPDAYDVICEKSKLNNNSPGFTQTLEESMEKIEAMMGVAVSEDGKDNDCQREVSPDRHHKTPSSFSGVSVSMEDQVKDTRVPITKTTPLYGEPDASDVICEKSKLNNDSPGFRLYMNLIASKQKGFKSLSEKEQQAVAKKVFDAIGENGGRFLKCISGKWCEYSDARAMQIIRGHLSASNQ